MNQTEKMTIEEGIALTDKTIDKALINTSGILSEMTSYLSLSKGKGVRTKVLLGASMSDNGSIQHTAAKAAAAVELLHMATLVHDDVIDNAPLRRGIDTLHAKFGKKEAVICGDYIFCLALNSISDLVTEDYEKYSKLLPSMTRSIKEVCEGEYKQLLENKNINLSIYDYLRIISGKTAALFRVSAYCGALIGGCCDREVENTTLFGKYLGMIFQIIDDCKDYQLTEEVAKKPVKNDIVQGVVTLPVILALRKNKMLASLATDVLLDKANPSSLIDAVINTGAIEDTKAVAARYVLKAERCLNKIENNVKREYLANILEQVQKSI